MAINSAFNPISDSFVFATSASVNTSQSRLILLSNLYGSSAASYPQSMRVHNSGTAPVWINFTSAAGVIAIPTAGTTTVGTPSASICLYPGLVEVFAAPAMLANPSGANPAVPGIFMQDISGTASQSYEIIFGEGL